MPTFALLVWPAAAIMLFFILPRRQALIWSLLAGYLLLPEKFGIDLPGVPPLNKATVVVIGALLGLLLVGDRRRRSEKGERLHGSVPPQREVRPLFLALLGLQIGGLFLTVAVNQAPLVYGPTTLPALQLWDALSMSWDVVIVVLPFFMARAWLGRVEDHRLLLRALTAAGLVYAILALVEIVLSPQLHNWVYGFHQHSFVQHIRSDSYRPKIFLQHGLWVGMFFLITALAALALSHVERQRSVWLAAAAALLLILLLSRNLGAVLIAVPIATLLLLPVALQRRSAMLIAVLFLIFPALRQNELVPIDQISALAEAISIERAESLEVRLKNESELLARAAENSLFGWGGYGRSRIFDERGVDLSVSDGLWVRVLGTQGWIGYIGFFGLLVSPLLFLGLRGRRQPLPRETTALMLILAANLVYLIPNNALSPVSWMISGALAGALHTRFRDAASSPSRGRAHKPSLSRRSIPLRDRIQR